MRIPITGIGVVAPGAVGIEAFRELLASGKSAVGEIDRFDTTDLTAHRAALVRDFKARDFIHPMKMRRMNVLSRYMAAAAKLAVDDCGGQLDPSTGVAIGTAFGPVRTSVEYLDEYVEKGAGLAPPQLFAESVANAPGSHIAIEWGLLGFNITFTQRESSALAAAMYGAAQLLKESVRGVLIGGVEEVNEVLFSVLDRLGALARATADGEEAARPFDRLRNGFAMGEGSALLVAGLGTRKPYGWLSGFGVARDQTATMSDWGTDEAPVVEAMRTALLDAELDRSEIDAVYVSGNGSRRGDAVEMRALEAFFGKTPPPLIATKGIFGEYAAGGALQLTAALVALDEQQLHPSVGFHDGDLPLNRELRSAEIRHLIVNSVSAGGGIVSAVLSQEGA